MKSNHKLVMAGGLAAFAVCLLVHSITTPVCNQEEAYVYIYDNGGSTSPVNSLCKSMEQYGTSWWQCSVVRSLALASGLNRHPHAGRYAAGKGTSALTLIRNIRNGHQSPVKLVIPSTLRTLNDLAEHLDEHLQTDWESMLSILNDSTELSQWGVTPETAITLFLPDTYEVYWNITPEGLLKRMAHERDVFWTEERMAQLRDMTREEVVTLASIVEQETQYTPERRRVAGMYVNRLQRGIPLQADPTVKFAIGDFSIKRVTHAHLATESPYNTYRHAGLPPGPICIPSKNSIDAVLQYEDHNYLYMCAKEDFSGSHNFATTYTEHLKNAARYSKALDERGIH